MKIKFLSILSAAVLAAVCLTSCGGQEAEDTDSYVQQDVSSVAEPEPERYFNNLTGEYIEGAAGKSDLRPVAVMINNLNKAQAVQTGLDKASITYETMVEGGITRLLCVYKDVASVGEIGTVRSARYSYVDLANGHDALYFHCGLDPTYCKPYLQKLKLDDIDINNGIFDKYGYRVKNGLSREHTLYTTGELIMSAMVDKERRTTSDSSTAYHYEAWQNFADEDETVTLSGGAADEVTVFFSSSYITTFKYDAQTGKYVKYNKSGNNTDYRTGEMLSYKNLAVLFTDVGNFPDNYRVYSKLDGGKGYYIVNGTYTEIKWSKGGTNDSLKLTDLDGNPLKYNVGNSYICITSKSNQGKTTIKSNAPQVSE